MSILISNSRNISIFYFELRLFVIHNEQSDPMVRNVCVVGSAFARWDHVQDKIILSRESWQGV